MPPNQNHQKDLFENNILFVICLAGLFRSALALIGDFPFEELTYDFLTDLGFTILFTYVVFLLYFDYSYRLILRLFYIPFILLLCLALIHSRGLASSVENNIFAGILLIALTMRGKLPLIYISTLIICTIISLIIVENINHFFTSYDDYSTSSFNFIFVSVAIIWVAFYGKDAFRKKREELEKTRASLEKKTQSIKLLKEELVDQKKELEALSILLESKVYERTEKLKHQNQMMEEYLGLTLTELMEPYQRTIKAINGLTTKNDEKVVQLIKTSGEELKREITQLRDKIKEPNEGS